MSTGNPPRGDGWSGWGGLNSEPWSPIQPRALRGETLSLELAPGSLAHGRKPNRPQRGQGLLVEMHANVFVIRPSTPIIHIFSFPLLRFSPVARSQIKHAVSSASTADSASPSGSGGVGTSLPLTPSRARWRMRCLAEWRWGFWLAPETWPAGPPGYPFTQHHGLGPLQSASGQTGQGAQRE